jgi:photosystem II stability/assembly factor-like uncharacterized protein
MTKPFFAGQASVWAQPDGLNTKPEYLGCHEVGDVEEPQGDVTLVFCPDPARSGKFVVSGSYQSDPGLITTSLTTPIQKTADYLESILCPFNLFVHKVSCGRRDLFTNLDRSYAFYNARVTSRGMSNLAVRDPGSEDESQQSFEISAETLLRYLTMTSARQTTTETEDINDITFCNVAKCADDCGPAASVCEYGVAVADAEGSSAGLEANVLITEDGGTTWTATVATPFDGSQDISSVVCFPLDRNTTRIIVARGTADAGAPAEISYSDDDGATWTDVNVGAVNGQFVNDEAGLFALDQWHIWLVTNDGYIYFSDDAGLTWAIQEAGVLAATGWNAIEFADANVGYVVGDNNEIAKTEDGGDSWTAVAGPAAQAAAAVDALEVIDANRIWLGYSDGELYYSEDGGTTIVQRLTPGIAFTTIESISFAHPMAGFVVGLVGAVGVLARTIDGGYTWQPVAMPTNTGLHVVYACDINTAFVAGPVTGGTGFIGKAFPE